MSPAANAIRQVNSDDIELVLECGDVKLVRRKRHYVEVHQLGDKGKWKMILTMSEIEAADFNNKIDELLRQ